MASPSVQIFGLNKPSNEVPRKSAAHDALARAHSHLTANKLRRHILHSTHTISSFSDLDLLQHKLSFVNTSAREGLLSPETAESISLCCCRDSSAFDATKIHALRPACGFRPSALFYAIFSNNFAYNFDELTLRLEVC